MKQVPGLKSGDGAEVRREPLHVVGKSSSVLLTQPVPPKQSFHITGYHFPYLYNEEVGVDVGSLRDVGMH